MKQLCAAVFFLTFTTGGATTAFAQHEGHVMAPAPAQEMPQMPMPKPKPKPKPKAPPRRSEPSRPAKPLAETLQPLMVHFERLKHWAGKVQMDFERLRTIENPDELREAMRQHSLMLDQLQMMLIEYEALLNDQMRPSERPANREASAPNESARSPQGAHAGPSQEKKP